MVVKNLCLNPKLLAARLVTDGSEITFVMQELEREYPGALLTFDSRQLEIFGLRFTVWVVVAKERAE